MATTRAGSGKPKGSATKRSPKATPAPTTVKAKATPKAKAFKPCFAHTVFLEWCADCRRANPTYAANSR